MTFISDLVQQLIDRSLVDPSDVLGCTQQELDELMRAQRVGSLPESYREFMLHAGKSPYWLTHTGEWDYNWLLQAKDSALELAALDTDDISPFEDSFVFQTHQGYQFYFFRSVDLSGTDPYFFIYEEVRGMRRSDSTFNEWLKNYADYLPQAIATRKRLGLQ